MKTEMIGVREHNECLTVELAEEKGRLCIHATNEGGYNGTNVDLLDLIEWLRANRPDLLA